MFTKAKIYWYARNYLIADIKFHLTRNVLWLPTALAAYCASPFSKKIGLMFAMWSARSRATVISMRYIRSNCLQCKDIFYSCSNRTVIDYKMLTKRMLILRYPNKEAKGVLLVKFSETLEHLILTERLTEILEKFVVIIEPSWAGYALPQILSLTAFKENIYIQCAEDEDYFFIKYLNKNLIPIKTGSGDWVDHNIFKPSTVSEKIYDVVLVANCNPIKRVYQYLNLIKNIGENQNIRAALVCSTHGKDYSNMIRLIKLFDLKNLDYFENLMNHEVNSILNSAKLNCLLSLKEGSNRTLFEGMASGVKGVVMTNNIGVNKDNLVPDSGYIKSEKELQKLILLRGHYDKNKVREWAEKNISPFVTMNKIVAVINDNEAETIDVHSVRLKVNKPEACYIEEDYEYNEGKNALEIALILGI